MSEKIVTLELRQKDSNSVAANGDFNITLQKPLVLSDGDAVSLYKSFIDTKAESEGRISFENDITLDAHFGYWAQNWNSTDRNYPSGVTDLDGNYYVINKNVSTDYLVIEEIYFSLDTTTGQNECGGKNIVFQYVDPSDGQGKKISLNFPTTGTNPDTGVCQTVNKPNLKVSPGSFSLVPGQTSIITDDMYCLPTPNITRGNTVTGSSYLSPLLNNKSFVIPKGDYDPLKLCELINAKFTENSGTISSTSASSNNVLIASSKAGDYPFNNLPSTNEYAFVSQDGTKAFSLNSSRTNEYYFGSSQIAFDYQNGRFVMTYNHLPYYTSSKQIGLKYAEKIIGGLPNNTFFLTNAASGLYFTSLHCTDNVSGLTINLFEDIMGFDMSKFIVTPQGNQQLNVAGIGAIVGYKYNLTLGDNIIAGSDTIDAAIQKGSSFQTVVVPGSLGEVSIDPSDTTQIVSEKVFEVIDTLQYGYFLIEIAGNYSTDYRGSKDVTGLIKGIVSRYYSYDSYTQGASDASLTYIHKGDPIYLNDFRIRVLDADKKLSTGIGEDNTFFLSVTTKQ